MYAPSHSHNFLFQAILYPFFSDGLGHQDEYGCRKLSIDTALKTEP